MIKFETNDNIKKHVSYLNTIIYTYFKFIFLFYKFIYVVK